VDIPAAKLLLKTAWPAIVDECRSVLGGELHYQAVIYHCLRNAGCPRAQIGMNVKQWIENPVTELFGFRDLRKHPNFRGGFEPVPDIVLFTADVEGDWRRRSYAKTLKFMVCAIEVKASERAKHRLMPREVRSDIAKLAAHRDELTHRGGKMYPVMMVIDVAPELNERMRADAIIDCAGYAAAEGVAWFYASPESDQCALPV
jgi:hypothetical protein